MYSKFTLDRSGNDASLALDLLRAVAAQMVCVGHGISFFMPQLRQSNLPLPQIIGVLIFFAMSGFVIAYTLVERSRDPNYGFPQFLVERFARIYSGLVPCLLLVALIDTFTVSLDPTGRVASSRTIVNFIGNLLMLEGYHGPLEHLDMMQWPIFGTVEPIWTLAVEWHIYMFAGAIFFIGARPSSAIFLIPVAIVFGTVPAHYAFGAAQADGIGTGLFLLWLGGACVYLLVRTWRTWPPAWLSAGVAVAAAIAFVAVTSARAEYRLSAYPWLLLMLLGVVAAGQRSRLITDSPHLAGVIRFLAGYSFTLYLIHHTLMFPLYLLWPDGGWPIFLAAVVASNLLAAALAMPTEMRHKDLARVLRRPIEAMGFSRRAANKPPLT
jgi:peptidoglycan/LPS O-acetylase OafA/YrhL